MAQIGETNRLLFDDRNKKEKKEKKKEKKKKDEGRKRYECIIADIVIRR